MSADPATQVTSRRNPRVVAARKLAQRKHRQAQGRFLVEGVASLEMAMAAGALPLEIFFCRQQLMSPEGKVLFRRLAETGAEAIELSPQVMQALAEREAPEGLLASFALFEQAPDAIPLTGEDLVVVLDRLQDPGNLGTLIRTADAVGAAAVFLLEPCVDPFDPKVVRATMGSLFALPLARTGNVQGLFSLLAQRGLRLVGADAHQGQAWGADRWRGGACLVLGNEARGLSPDVSAQIQHFVRLPLTGHAESLNVAVAGGVFMYRWLEANRPDLYES